MKAKNLIYLLTGLLFLSSCNKSEPLVRRYSIFNYFEHMKHMALGPNSWKEDKDEDGINDHLMILYDLNGNKIPDAVAGYEILMNAPFLPPFDTDANYVYVDENEDGEFEYDLQDKNDNRRLEKKTKYKESKQPQGIPI